MVRAAMRAMASAFAPHGDPSCLTLQDNRIRLAHGSARCIQSSVKVLRPRSRAARRARSGTDSCRCAAVVTEVEAKPEAVHAPAKPAPTPMRWREQWWPISFVE